MDIDEAAIRASRENARSNGIPDESFALGVGSVGEILAGQFDQLSSATRGLRRAPLVLANILAPVLVRLFDGGLADLLEPHGSLVLSGILKEQSESVLAAARSKGLELAASKQMGDWVTLLVK